MPTAAQDNTAVQQLFLGPMNEIRHADGSPALGWRTKPEAGTFSIARPVRLADELLAAKPTSKLDYAANLPAPPRAARSEFTLGDCVFDKRSAPRSVCANGAAFLRQSLDGGSARVICADGRSSTVHIRWVCLSRDWQIGAVWRAFQRLDGEARWRRCGPDHLFDPAGELVSFREGEPASSCGGIELVAEQGALTHYPSALGLVKLRHLRADGQPKRNLKRLQANAAGEIEAVLSGGITEVAGYLALPGQNFAAAA